VEFHRAVVDENPSDYNVIIPEFHHLTKRYNAFLTSVRKDAYQRAEMARSEIDFLEKAAKNYFFLDEMIEKQEIPQRVVHYDTKLSNILFSKKSVPICLIDYDTVMPGTWLFDFADAARSICNSSEEDEQNPKKVAFLNEHFEALKEGYLNTLDEYLICEEKKHLNAATGYLILEQAIRFLDDFLRGDVYYKTEFDGQNLQRARVQIKLFQHFIENHY
jgi:N-acetylhexosamine 1-kinase